MTLEVKGSNPFFYLVLKFYKSIGVLNFYSYFENICFSQNTQNTLLERVFVLKNNCININNNFLYIMPCSDLKKTFFNNISWKRSLRYNITLIKESNIVLNLTFRKYFVGSLNEQTLKTRWLTHSFFMFKNIYFFSKMDNYKFFFFFNNTNSFFFNTQTLFFENYHYFFRKKKNNFLFFFYSDYISYKLHSFKKIKSIKKFKKKIYSVSNRKHINLMLKIVK